MNSKIKIGSLLSFSIMLIIVAALAITINVKKDTTITKIEMKGNNHLEKESYFSFANLEDENEWSNLTPGIIKDRLEKHPYIKRVDALFENGELKIDIVERNFIALLMNGEKEYLITENSTLIPKLKGSLNIDYPIISEPAKSKIIKPFINGEKNSDVKIGLKILYALKLADISLANNLSEIDLRDGKDILMQFANLDIPVIIGRGNEIKKILMLGELVNNYTNLHRSSEFDYIDLRYKNFIYLGISEGYEINS